MLLRGAHQVAWDGEYEVLTSNGGVSTCVKVGGGVCLELREVPAPCMDDCVQATDGVIVVEMAAEQPEDGHEEPREDEAEGTIELKDVTSRWTLAFDDEERERRYITSFSQWRTKGT